MLDYTKKLALALNTLGLINIQYAVKDGTVFILEANPRASRTVPYVSKTIGIPLAKMATRIILGKTLKQLGLTEYKEPGFASVKEVVFPFLKLQGVDPVLGPEMKSTGEVMGIDENFEKAFFKAESAAQTLLPKAGNILITIGPASDKKIAVPFAKQLVEMGFSLYCTRTTAEEFEKSGMAPIRVPKIRDDPKILTLMKEKKIHLVVNIPRGSHPKSDAYQIRRACVDLGIPLITTMTATKAAVNAIKALKTQELKVQSLQEYHQFLA